jgi:hypothetical protein
MRPPATLRLALATLVVLTALAPRRALAGAPLFAAGDIHLFDVTSRSGGKVVDFIHGGSLYALYVDGTGRAVLGRRAGTLDDEADILDDAPAALERALDHSVVEMWRLSPAEARHYARVVRSQTDARSRSGTVLMHRVFPRQAGRLRRFATSLESRKSLRRPAHSPRLARRAR